MPRYCYTQDYRSSYGQGVKGEEAELTDDQAAAINRDSPGTLVRAKTEQEARAVDAPPQDRQVKAAPKTRTRGDG